MQCQRNRRAKNDVRRWHGKDVEWLDEEQCQTSTNEEPQPKIITMVTMLLIHMSHTYFLGKGKINGLGMIFHISTLSSTVVL